LSGGGLATFAIYDTGTAYNGTNPGGGITFRGKYTSSGSLTNFATVQGIKENTTDGNYATALRFTTRSNGGSLTERMRIDSSGNLRVGAGNTFEPVLQFTGSGRAQANPGFTFNGDLDTGMFNPSTQNTIAFATAGTERMRIDSAGDVGIGVAPATHARLTLGGTATSYSSSLVFDNNTTGGAEFFMLASDNTWSAGANKFLMGHGSPASSAVDITIDADGYVGIGTTSPGYKLDVYEASGNGLRIKAGDQIADVALSVGSAGTADKFVIQSGGNVGIGTTTPGNKFTLYDDGGYWATIQRGNSTPGSNAPWLGLFNNINISNATYGWGIYDSNVDGSFQIWNKNNSTTGYNTFTIKRGGNVGIGTTVPQSKLETNLHSGASSSLMNANTTNDVHLIRAGFGASASTTSNAGAKWGLRFVGRNDGTYDTGKSGAIYAVSEDSAAGYNREVGLAFHVSDFDAGNVEAMRIDSDGKVGIGTNDPGKKLEVSVGSSNTDGIRITGSSANTSLIINNTGSNGVAWDISSTGAGHGYGEGALHFGVGFGTPKMKITSAGNVGIGRTDPGYVLDVKGTGSTLARFLSASDDALVRIIANNYGTEADARLFLGENDVYGMTVEYDGNANIGYIGMNNNVQPNLAYSKRIQMSRSGTETAFMAGNVGIGTASPNVKLAVDGQLSAGGRRLSLGILDLNSATTPTQFKITTNIPFASGSADFTVNIKGFRYGTNDMVDLSIGWHYYNSTFYSASVKSSGAWAPTVTLGVENSKVVIHLASPSYWPKMYVESLYSSAYRDSYAAGWSWADSAISSDSGTPQVSPAYSINFGNNFKMLDDGRVGIGATPTAKLHVFKGESGAVANNTDSTLVLENSSHTYINFLTPANKEAGILWGDDANNNTGMVTYSHITDNMTITAADDIVLNADKINVGNNKPLWSGSFGGALFLKGNNATAARHAELTIVNSTGASIGTGLVVDNDLQVGIGTEDPDCALDVTRTTGWAEMHLDGASGGDLIFKDNGFNMGEIYAGVGHGMVLKSYASQNMSFLTGGNATAKMTLDTSGRLAINQAPLSNNFALQVTGLGGASNDARAVYLKGTGNHTSIGGTGPTLVLQNTNTTANNIVKLSFESASSGETVSINAINTNHSSHYGDMAFNTRGSGGYSEKLRITSNGFVGIGYTSPSGSEKLGSRGDRAQIASSNSNYGKYETVINANFTGGQSKYIRIQLNGGNVQAGMRVHASGNYSNIDANGSFEKGYTLAVNSSNTSLFGGGTASSTITDLGSTSTQLSMGSLTKPNATTVYLPVENLHSTYTIMFCFAITIMGEIDGISSIDIINQ